jgi:hypothetical protein
MQFIPTLYDCQSLWLSFRLFYTLCYNGMCRTELLTGGCCIKFYDCFGGQLEWHKMYISCWIFSGNASDLYSRGAGLEPRPEHRLSEVFCGVLKPLWGTRCRSWLRHCATSRKVAGSIPDRVTGIFQWLNPSGRIVALGSTQPLTEMSTRNPS